MATYQVCYYLGSRFYLPELGRFLNADIYADTGTGVVGTNMFAYCNNNPVMYVDPSGEASVSVLVKLVSYIVNIVVKSTYTTQAKKMLREIGYINSTYSTEKSIFSGNNNEYLQLILRTKWKNSTNPLGKVATYTNANFERRSIAEWKEIVTKPLLQRIPLLSSVDDFCKEWPLFAELMYAIFEEYVDPRITLAWDFLSALAYFYDDKDINNPDESPFTEREKYIINEMNRRGLMDKDDKIMIIMTYATHYKFTDLYFFPRNPYIQVLSVFKPY